LLLSGESHPEKEFPSMSSPVHTARRLNIVAGKRICQSIARSLVRPPNDACVIFGGPAESLRTLLKHALAAISVQTRCFARPIWSEFINGKNVVKRSAKQVA